MSVFSGPEIINDSLVFHYDIANTQKSWKGAPTTNRIFTTPIPLSLYAYVTGPTTTTVIDATFKSKSVTRYTISQVINTARAAIFVPNGSLALSTPYAFSCIWKYNGTNTATPSFIIDAVKGNPEATGANTFSSFVQTNVALTNGWTYSKLEFTLSASPTLGSYLTFGISTGSDSTYLNNTFDVYNVQFEQNTFATPYVEGIRSNTQALVDLTGNNTITATSLTYASDGTFSFDGTSDRIITSSNITYGNNTTWEAWMNCSQSTNTYNMFMGRHLPYFGFYTGDGLIFSNSIGGSQQTVYKYGGLSLNTWYHTVFTTSYDGSNTTASIYVNGVLVSSAIQTGAQGNGIYQFVVGDGQSTAWFPFKGKVNNVNVYNRALLAFEVQQNFNATRSRFGV